MNAPTATWGEVFKQARLLLALNISGLPTPAFLRRPSTYVSRRIIGKDYLNEQRATDRRYDEWKSLDASVDEWAKNLVDQGLEGTQTVDAARALALCLLQPMHGGTLTNMRVLNAGSDFSAVADLRDASLLAVVRAGTSDEDWTLQVKLFPSRDKYEDITVTHLGDITSAVFNVIGAAFRILPTKAAS
jgi:hypothetical protein